MTTAEIAKTVAALRAVHLRTERDGHMEAHLMRLLQLGDDGAVLPVPVRFTGQMETRGVALIEEAGGGKTTTVRKVLQDIEPLRLNPETGAPRYVYAKVSSPATQKSLGIGILGELGIDHVAERARVWEIWDLVRRRLKDMGIVVLWIDEAHDLFKGGSPREIEDMLKMLKGLMQGDEAVIVVLSGTERLSRMTAYDPQVSRRFSKIVPGDLEIGVHNAEMEELIQFYCERADLEFRGSNDLASRLIYGSRKRFGRAIEATINAIERALVDGDKTLTPKHFAEAWGMQEGCPWDRNVFVAEDWETIELDAPETEFDAERPVRTRKRGKRG